MLRAKACHIDACASKSHLVVVIVVVPLENCSLSHYYDSHFCHSFAALSTGVASSTIAKLQRSEKASMMNDSRAILHGAVG